MLAGGNLVVHAIDRRGSGTARLDRVAPVAAGSGEGRLDYIIPGILGMLVGALLFGLTYNSVYLQLNKIASEAPVVLPALIDTNPWLVIGLFTVFVPVFDRYAISASTASVDSRYWM